mgnify:FL=1
MKDIPTYLPVVAAAIGPLEDRWLMHRRPEDKAHGGLWEFPGGKIEAGESARAALVREIAEECGLEVDPAAMVEAGFAAQEPAECGCSRPILLLLFLCPTWAGEPTSREGGQWRWCTRDQIVGLAMPPLDRVLAARLFA